MNEKAIFKNEIFYWGILIYLFILILINGYNLFYGIALAILPLTIQITLVVLIFDKSKYVKKGILFWSILLMLGPFLIIISQLLKGLAGDDLDSNKILTNLLMLLIAVSIYYFNKETVEIINIDNNKELE